MSTFLPDSNLLIIVGYSDVENTDSVAKALSQQLGIPVWSAFLEGYPSVGEAIREGVVTYRPKRIVVLPLFLGATEAQKNNIGAIVDAAQDRWSEVEIIYGKPLAYHSDVVAAYQQLVREIIPVSAKSTTMLVVGRGSRDAESNAEVYHMARLLYEGFIVGAVDVAFYRKTQPTIAAGIKRCVQSGAQRIVVVPYLLYEKSLYQEICTEIQQLQTQYSDVEILTAPHLEVQTGIVEAISQRYYAALKALDLPPDEETLRRRSHGHSHGTKETPASLGNLLPPRYQEGVIVSAAPMGAADLIYDAKGQVAWDEIWGGFCDLALAGGPPHRSTLLEPVSPESVRANRERYQQVLAELERGIVMVTRLPVVASKSPGWIGIQCASEDMALWLLRAIVVENISIRREDAVLYLPAGPDFRLEHEIKNVITVVAKTHHYWTEHITSKTQTELSTS